MIRGQRTCAKPPVEHLEMTPREEMQLQQFLGAAIVGGPETVRDGLEAFLEQTGADELMLNTDVYTRQDGLRANETAAGGGRGGGGGPPGRDQNGAGLSQTPPLYT